MIRKDIFLIILILKRFSKPSLLANWDSGKFLAVAIGGQTAGAHRNLKVSFEIIPFTLFTL